MACSHTLCLTEFQGDDDALFALACAPAQSDVSRHVFPLPSGFVFLAGLCDHDTLSAEASVWLKDGIRVLAILRLRLKEFRLPAAGHWHDAVSHRICCVGVPNCQVLGDREALSRVACVPDTTMTLVCPPVIWQGGRAPFSPYTESKTGRCFAGFSARPRGGFGRAVAFTC